MHDPDKCIAVNLMDDCYKQIIFQVDDEESAKLEMESALRPSELASRFDIQKTETTRMH